MKCENCGKEFQPKKRSARFCCSSCRAKAWIKANGRKKVVKSSLSDTLKGVLGEETAKPVVKKSRPGSNENCNRILSLHVLREFEEQAARDELEQLIVDRGLFRSQNKVLCLIKDLLLTDTEVRSILIGYDYKLEPGDPIFDALIECLWNKKVGLFNQDYLIPAKPKHGHPNLETILMAVTEKMHRFRQEIVLCDTRINQLRSVLNRPTPRCANNELTRTITIEKENIGSHNKPNVTQNDCVTNEIITQRPQETGAHSKLPPSDKIITSVELAKMKHKSFNFTVEWKEFLGQPEIDFHCAVHGMSGHGKSTLVTMFSVYLAEHFGRVVYISGEEAFRKTLKDKFIRMNAVNESLHVANLRTFEDIIEKVPNGSDGYHFIVIDSLDTMRIDAAKLKQLKERFKDSAFITISQATKSGQMRGSYEIIHDADIEIKVEKGIAVTLKNRFDVTGKEFRVF